MKWDAWDKIKGVPKRICQKMFVKLAHEVLIENGYAKMIEQDPKRPGPNYYDDCIKFNWVDALIDKHKDSLSGNNKNLYNFDLNKEEQAALQ